MALTPNRAGTGARRVEIACALCMPSIVRRRTPTCECRSEDGAAMLPVDQRSELLDAINLQLLAELQAAPRRSMSELARRVGMSAPAVTERVSRMERAGIITGYRMEVD